MKNIKYTNEFLKNLEKIVAKEDLKTLKEIKNEIEKISNEKIEKKELKNIQTDEKKEIFQTETKEINKQTQTIFWCEKAEEKIIITMIKKASKK